MAKPGKSIFDGMEYLYAEQLKGKRVSLTIKSVEAKEIVGDQGRKKEGFVFCFEETPKKFAVTGATVRRQLALACGTEDPDEFVGKKITLYPIESSRSISGQAIRVAIPEHAA
jgi:hypothetical protein